MPIKICLLSDHHLCINPRLWKEAFFYEKEGYEVVILTMWLSRSLLIKDQDILTGHNITYKCFLNLIPGEINIVSRFFYRLRKRIASELQRYLKIGTGWAISHAPEKMYRKALEEKADLYAAHLECGFLGGRKLIKAGKNVSFDFEDWYSRDYLTSDRAVQLLTKLEAFALKKGLFCTAASQAMADALIETHPFSKKITTIYNSFPEEEIKMENYAEILTPVPFRLLWTSRTVGSNRGLETLVEALHQINTLVELHIIGQCVEDYERYLQSLWPKNENLKFVFYDFISHNELMKRIPGFDLGIAIENKEPDNKNKTISNKILQYIQSGIRVFATDTDGQREVNRYIPDSVFIVNPGQAQQWKNTLEKIIAEGRQRINEVQAKQFNEIFSWSVQEQKLRVLISENLLK